MQQKTSTLSVRQIAISALFVALVSVCAQITIPIQPVPFSFQIFAVMLCCAILPLKLSFCTQFAYILLGALGAPIFTLFQGGFQKIVGPTGGYLIGYLFFALITGILMARRDRPGFWWTAFSLFLGMLACYLCAVLWLCVSARYTFWQAVVVGFLPYIAFDVIKLVCAAALSIRLREALQKAGLYF